MTWDLQADIDYSGDQLRLVNTLIDLFREDLKDVLVHTTRGDWPLEEISNLELPVNNDLIYLINEEYKKYKADDVCFQVLLSLHVGEVNYLPTPEIYVFGDELQGMSNRRRSPAVIGFGNRNAWKGESKLLKTGRKLDEALVMSVLKEFCLRIRPESLYLINEESVSLAINDHFVYHSNLTGFENDIDDLTRIFLYGGKGYYTDARARYEPIVSEENSMAFCKRTGLYRERLKDYLALRLPKIETLNAPKINLDIVETALLESDDEMDYFFDGDGLGFFAKPALKKYVEPFFIEIIDTITV